MLESDMPQMSQTKPGVEKGKEKKTKQKASAVAEVDARKKLSNVLKHFQSQIDWIESALKRSLHYVLGSDEALAILEGIKNSDQYRSDLQAALVKKGNTITAKQRTKVIASVFNKHLRPALSKRVKSLSSEERDVVLATYREKIFSTIEKIYKTSEEELVENPVSFPIHPFKNDTAPPHLLQTFEKLEMAGNEVQRCMGRKYFKSTSTDSDVREYFAIREAWGKLLSIQPDPDTGKSTDLLYNLLTSAPPQKPTVSRAPSQVPAWDSPDQVTPFKEVRIKAMDLAASVSFAMNHGLNSISVIENPNLLKEVLSLVEDSDIPSMIVMNPSCQRSTAWSTGKMTDFLSSILSSRGTLEAGTPINIQTVCRVFHNGRNIDIGYLTDGKQRSTSFILAKNNEIPVVEADVDTDRGNSKLKMKLQSLEVHRPEAAKLLKDHSVLARIYSPILPEGVSQETIQKAFSEPMDEDAFTNTISPVFELAEVQSDRLFQTINHSQTTLTPAELMSIPLGHKGRKAINYLLSKSYSGQFLALAGLSPKKRLGSTLKGSFAEVTRGSHKALLAGSLLFTLRMIFSNEELSISNNLLDALGRIVATYTPDQIQEATWRLGDAMELMTLVGVEAFLVTKKGAELPSTNLLMIRMGLAYWASRFYRCKVDNVTDFLESIGGDVETGAECMRSYYREVKSFVMYDSDGTPDESQSFLETVSRGGSNNTGVMQSVMQIFQRTIDPHLENKLDCTLVASGN